MRMKIYLNCVRMHCVVFKYVVIQLNHRNSFHCNEGLQAGSTFRQGKFSCSMVHSNASTAASFLAKLTSTSWRPLPRLKRGCSPSLQNWRKWFLVAVYLMLLLSVKVSVKRPDEGSATIKTWKRDIMTLVQRLFSTCFDIEYLSLIHIWRCRRRG